MWIRISNAKSFEFLKTNFEELDIITDANSHQATDTTIILQ